MHPQLALLGERSSSCCSSYVQFNLTNVECRNEAERSILASVKSHNGSISPGFSLRPMALGEAPSEQPFTREHVSDTASQSSKRSGLGKKKERRTRKSRSNSTTGGTNTKTNSRREVVIESNTKQLDDIDVQQVEHPRSSITSPVAESMNMFNQRFEVPT